MDDFDFTANEYAAANTAEEKNSNLPEDNAVYTIKNELRKLLSYSLDLDVNAIRFAFRGFEDYLCISDISIIKRIIPDIEKSIKNELELCIKSDSIYNKAFIVLQSYYILFIVNILKIKNHTAITYLLQSFIFSPIVARKKMFPIIYSQYFEPLFFNEYINMVSDNMPIDPRTYMKHHDLSPALLEHSRNLLGFNIKLEQYINNQCRNIAEQSLDNIDAYNRILSILSLR